MNRTDRSNKPDRASKEIHVDCDTGMEADKADRKITRGNSPGDKSGRKGMDELLWGLLPIRTGTNIANDRIGTGEMGDA
jgi:hypothetical protein